MLFYSAGSKRAGDKLPGGDIKRVRLGANVHGMVSRAKAAKVAGDCTFRTGELLEKILLNLSTEDLVKCVRVSKDWRKFITETCPDLQRKMFLLAGPATTKREFWSFDKRIRCLRLHDPSDYAFLDTVGKDWKAHNFLLFPAVLNPLIFKAIPETTRAITEEDGIPWLSYYVDTFFKARPDLVAFRNALPRDKVPVGKGNMVYKMFLTQPPVKDIEVKLSHWVQHPTNVGPRPETLKHHIDVTNPNGVLVSDLFAAILDFCGGIQHAEKAHEAAIRVAGTTVWHKGPIFATQAEKDLVRSGVFNQLEKPGEGVDIGMSDDDDED